MNDECSNEDPGPLPLPGLRGMRVSSDCSTFILCRSLLLRLRQLIPPLQIGFSYTNGNDLPEIKQQCMKTHILPNVDVSL